MSIQKIDSALFQTMVYSGANCLENNKEMVNSLNVFPVPDGDTGTNMSLTMLSAVKEVEKVNNIVIPEIAEAIANGSLMGARGNSGVILSQIFRGMAKGLKNAKELDCKNLAHALQEGAKTAYKAVMKPTEGTILTVIRETGDYAMANFDQYQYVDVFLEDIIASANKTLEHTPELLPVLKQAGVVDAGGKGLICILEGMLYAINNKTVLLKAEHTPVASVNIEDNTEILKMDLGEIVFGYCTEFFIKGKNIQFEKFKNQIAEKGDSIVVVGDEKLVKTHIHTNHPGEVLELAMKLGELDKVKIDNMREQNRELTKMQKQEPKSVVKEEKEYGFVAVAMGDGIADIFEQLGVDEVIEGGQTMNPSTEDIINSINNINAKNIFIFPNNSNIVLAANQAKDISEKNVMVIPTKTVPQGIAGIMAVEFNRNAMDNINKINQAVQSVKTAQVTYAVRDSQYEDFEIKEGNILGLLEGKITEVGDKIENIAMQIIESMVDDDASLITLYYGEEVKENEASDLVEQIEEKYPDYEVELHKGNQPIYYYIISME